MLIYSWIFFNYNAHSTAIDSLWAELPVVTMMGRSFSARVGGSLLKAIGLEELITENTKQYEEVIIDLGNNPEKLKLIKRKIKLEKRGNLLFDSFEFTNNLEKIYLNLIKIDIEGMEWEVISSGMQLIKTFKKVCKMLCEKEKELQTKLKSLQPN